MPAGLLWHKAKERVGNRPVPYWAGTWRWMDMDNTHFQLFVAPPWPHVAVTSQSFCIAEACGKRCHCIHLARPNPPIYFNIFLSPHNYTYTCLFSCPSGPSGLLSNFNYQDEKSKAIHWPPELDRKSFFKCGCKKDSFHTHHPIVYRASLPFPPSPSLPLSFNFWMIQDVIFKDHFQLSYKARNSGLFLDTCFTSLENWSEDKWCSL